MCNSFTSLCLLILFENQIQTTSTSPCRTQVQPAASFLVCSLIFIEYDLYCSNYKFGIGMFFLFPEEERISMFRGLKHFSTK